MAHWKVPSRLGLSSCPNAVDATKAFEQARTERLRSISTQSESHDIHGTDSRDMLSSLPVEIVSIIANHLCTYERSESSGHRRAVITTDFFKLRLVCRAWASTFGSIFTTLTKRKPYEHYAVLNLPPKSPKRVADLVELFQQADEAFRNAVTSVVWHALPAWQIRSEKDILKHIEGGLAQHQSYGPLLADHAKIENIARNSQRLFGEYQIDQNNLIQDISKNQDGESVLSELLGLLPNVQSLSLQNFDFWMRVDEELNRLRKRASPIVIWHPPISKQLHIVSEFGDRFPYRLPGAFLQTLQELPLLNIISLRLTGIESDFLFLGPSAERKMCQSPCFQAFMQRLTTLELSLARRELVRKRWLYRCDWDFYDRPIENHDLSNAGRFNRFIKMASNLEHLTVRLERMECLENTRWSWGSYLSKVLEGQFWTRLERFSCYGFGISDEGLLSFLTRHSASLRDAVIEDVPLDAPLDYSEDETDDSAEGDDVVDPILHVHRLLTGLRDELTLSQVSIVPRNGGLYLGKSRDTTLRRLGGELRAVVSHKNDARARWQSYYSGINRWILHQWEP